MNSQGLQAQRTADLRSAIGNLVLAAGGLAIDAVTSKFKTVNTIPFTIDGVFKSKAAATALVFSAGHATVPAGYSCLFLVGLDGSGNVTTYQGDLYKSEVNQQGDTKYRCYNLVTNAAGTVAPQKTGRLVDYTAETAIPQPAVPPAIGSTPSGIPENVAIIGAIKVVSGGSDFVPGTTALTGIATYYDLAGVLPATTQL